MTEKLVWLLASIGRALRLVLGAPDYDRYVAHVRSAHPGSDPVSRAQFEHERLDARYTRPGSRCC